MTDADESEKNACEDADQGISGRATNLPRYTGALADLVGDISTADKERHTA